ncbi:MAG: 2-phospho-L-lactate guanylyltransferase [Hadesarchaea archaeon]|nr:2-phospho-L-lactate guanylyltransferase [Hadesarchaea archaeon]
MNTRMIIPVKNLEEAKTSFSEVLTEEERKKLTLAMLEDVLVTSGKVKEIKQIVVTPDESVRNFVEDLGFKSIIEEGIGLNNALRMVIEESIDSGFREVLIMPADVPLLRPEDISNILGLTFGERCVVMTPSKENGTNALLLRPPNVINLHFGGESFPRHLEEARSKDLNLEVYQSKRLERDIDNPSDLLKVKVMGAGTKTQEFLEGLE